MIKMCIRDSFYTIGVSKSREVTLKKYIKRNNETETIIFESIKSYLITVSYTHLDVYKRQNVTTNKNHRLIITVVINNTKWRYPQTITHS